MCDKITSNKPIFWGCHLETQMFPNKIQSMKYFGCPAPLATANYNINNPPFLRPFLIQPEISYPSTIFREQTWAVRQPSRAPTLAPWQGQPIPPRPVAYIPTATW